MHALLLHNFATCYMCACQTGAADYMLQSALHVLYFQPACYASNHSRPVQPVSVPPQHLSQVVHASAITLHLRSLLH
jgi:hypothetical protein